VAKRFGREKAQKSQLRKKLKPESFWTAAQIPRSSFAYFAPLRGKIRCSPISQFSDGFRRFAERELVTAM